MASSKTLDLMRFMNQISYKLGCIPFHITRQIDSCSARCTYGDKRHVKRWRIVTTSHLMLRLVVFMGIGIPFDLLSHNLRLIERVLFYFMLIVESTSSFCELLILIYSQRMQAVVHGAFLFNAKL